MALIPSPIQMTDYAVLHQVHIRHRPGEGPAVEMAHTVEIRASAQRSPDGILLDAEIIANGPADDAAEPAFDQEGQVRVAARIRWASDESPDHREHLLIVNGMSLLYGVARTHLLQASALSPGPRLMLPSFSFREFELPLDEPPGQQAGAAQATQHEAEAEAHSDEG